MRVLVLTDSYPPRNLGGAGEVAYLVSTGLAARGHDVLVATTATRRRDSGVETVDGVQVHRLWAPVPSALRLHLSVVNPLAMARVRTLARQFKADVVHAHNVHERLSFSALTAARVDGTPLVLTAHDYLLFCLTKFLCSNGRSDYRATPSRCDHCRHIRRVPARNRLVHGLVKRNVSAVACISQAQRSILTINGFADVPLDVVYNGINPNVRRTSPAERKAWRDKHDIDSRPLVLFGGRISGAKGGDQLLRAMVHVRKQVDAQLAILGDRQIYFEHARRLAAAEGLDQDALHTIGWLGKEELDLAFEAADVCTSPSVYPDPFNLMNVRAMVHEKPVVGTCYGGTPEIVLHGETGLIADPWNADSFGECIVELLTQPDLAQRLGRRGLQRAEEQFSLDRQIDGYLALYARARHSASAALPHHGSTYSPQSINGR